MRKKVRKSEKRGKMEIKGKGKKRNKKRESCIMGDLHLMTQVSFYLFSTSVNNKDRMIFATSVAK